MIWTWHFKKKLRFCPLDICYYSFKGQDCNFFPRYHPMMMRFQQVQLQAIIELPPKASSLQYFCFVKTQTSNLYCTQENVTTRFCMSVNTEEVPRVLQCLILNNILWPKLFKPGFYFPISLWYDFNFKNQPLGYIIPPESYWPSQPAIASPAWIPLLLCSLKWINEVCA